MIIICVFVSLHVDPAFNNCRDPGTPAYGIPIMAQGFQVREFKENYFIPDWSKQHIMHFK